MVNRISSFLSNSKLFALLTIIIVALLDNFLDYVFEGFAPWYYLDKFFVYLLVVLGFSCLISPSMTPKKIISIALVVFIFRRLALFETVANWFFYDSPWANTLLLNVNPKDSDFIIMISLLFLFMFFVLKFLFKYFSGKVNVNEIILAITFSVAVVITTIFHLYAVEFNYSGVRTNILAEMEYVSDQPREDFYAICKFRKWVCYYKGDNITKADLISQFPQNIRDISEYNKIFNKNAFMADSLTFRVVGKDDRVRFIVFKKNFNLLIDTFRHRDAFDEAERLFQMLGSFGHGFWSIFTIILLLVHGKRNILTRFHKR